MTACVSRWEWASFLYFSLYCPWRGKIAENPIRGDVLARCCVWMLDRTSLPVAAKAFMNAACRGGAMIATVEDRNTECLLYTPCTHVSRNLARQDGGAAVGLHSAKLPASQNVSQLQNDRPCHYTMTGLSSSQALQESLPALWAPKVASTDQMRHLTGSTGMRNNDNYILCDYCCSASMHSFQLLVCANCTHK